MADPVGALSIAFNAAPMAAHPVWTRIDTLEGCRVRDWTVDRGRPNEFEKTDTGTATVRIVDRANLFDPTNGGSPYFGKILPGKQAAIALQNPVSGEWHTIFRGFVESWHYQLGQTREHTELELQLVDGFAMLARAELQVGVDGIVPLPVDMAEGNIGYGHTDGSVDDRITEILEDVGWPFDLREPGVDIFSGNVRVGPKVYPAGTSALDALWDAADAEFAGGLAVLFMSKDGHVSFRGRYARFNPDTAEYGIQRRTVGDPSAWSVDEDVVPISELEWTLGMENIINIAIATPERVEDDGEWRQLNPDAPDNDDVQGQYVRNEASITAYGPSAVTFDQLQTVYGIATGYDALQETKMFAAYYVNNFSTPEPRVSRMVFRTRRPDAFNAEALWLHLCKCEIGDLLTLQTDHGHGGGFGADFYVEGIHYTCRPGSPGLPIVELSLDVSPRAHYAIPPT